MKMPEITTIATFFERMFKTEVVDALNFVNGHVILICREIDSLNKFLWGNDKERRRCHLVATERMADLASDQPKR